MGGLCLVGLRHHIWRLVIKHTGRALDHSPKMVHKAYLSLRLILVCNKLFNAVQAAVFFAAGRSVLVCWCIH